MLLRGLVRLTTPPPLSLDTAVEGRTGVFDTFVGPGHRVRTFLHLSAKGETGRALSGLPRHTLIEITEGFWFRDTGPSTFASPTPRTKGHVLEYRVIRLPGDEEPARAVPDLSVPERAVPGRAFGALASR